MAHGGKDSRSGECRYDGRMSDARDSEGGAGVGRRPPPELRPPEGRPARSLAPRLPLDERAGSGAGSLGRAAVYGIGIAAAGAAVHVLAATLFLWTAGLLALAPAIAVVVGLAVVTGGGSALRPWPRRGLAVALAVGAVGAAAGLNWALSGMYLEPLTYLAEVYGFLAPAQLVLAAAGALFATR